jgi:hypothetical protein
MFKTLILFFGLISIWSFLLVAKAEEKNHYQTAFYPR